MIMPCGTYAAGFPRAIQLPTTTSALDGVRGALEEVVAAALGVYVWFER